MQIYGSTHIHGPQSVTGPHSARTASPASPPQTLAPSDQLDISAAAAAAAEANGDVRADLVARVRDEIAAGTYETPEKIDGAIERLLDEIG